MALVTILPIMIVLFVLESEVGARLHHMGEGRDATNLLDISQSLLRILDPSTANVSLIAAT